MRRHHLWLALVLVYAATFRILTLNRPFDYDAEGSGSLNAVLARSYLRFDFGQTHGMPVLSLDPGRATPIVFYPDHPPLVPLLIMPFYRAFGVGEWQTRLPIAMATIGAIWVLYQLLATFASPRTGVIAAAVFALTPMTLYFGGFADVVGTPLMLCCLIAVLGYLRFHTAPGLRTCGEAVAAFIPAAICDWPAYVLIPVFAVHYLVTRPRRDWPWMVGFAVTGCALFAALYAYITLATHEDWTWMIDLFARRSALVGGRAYTRSAWMAAVLETNRRYHTLPLLVVAGTSMAVLALRRGSSDEARVVWLLLAWALLYASIGAKALFDHEWAWMVFTPAFAASAALLIARAPDRLIAIGLVGFGAWTTLLSYGALYPSYRDRAFTPRQMAQAIQSAAPRPTDIALVVGNEAEAQLWFYADRPLRTGIWSVDDFERRLNDDTVDLMFNFDEQPWKGHATGIVFPEMWLERIAPLHEYLRQRYMAIPLPADVARPFEAFDLTRPLLTESR